MCPTCKNQNKLTLIRCQKKIIFKLLPGSRLYKCFSCSTKYVAFLNYKIYLENKIVVIKATLIELQTVG